MKWRLAKSLEVLRQQINRRWADRDKLSDGTKGDDAHAARKSDHNPDSDGVVCALDITHDPAHGLSSEELAQALIRSRDVRIANIISNRKIASGSSGPQPWQWRVYTGANPHNHHCHISVKHVPAHRDSPAEWDLTGVYPPSKDHSVPKIRPVLRKGARGGDVKELQRLLGVAQDGTFGTKTENAVKAQQRAHKLLDDGVVGPYTWDILT